VGYLTVVGVISPPIASSSLTSMTGPSSLPPSLSFSRDNQVEAAQALPFRWPPLSSPARGGSEVDPRGAFLGTERVSFFVYAGEFFLGVPREEIAGRRLPKDRGGRDPGPRKPALAWVESTLPEWFFGFCRFFGRKLGLERVSFLDPMGLFRPRAKDPAREKTGSVTAAAKGRLEW